MRTRVKLRFIPFSLTLFWVVLFFAAVFLPTLKASSNPLPTGTFSQTSLDPSACLRDATQCIGYRVSCPGVQQAAAGHLAISQATASPRGVVMFFSASRGTGWYSAPSDLFTSLQAEGFTVVKVAWQVGWSNSAPGELAGPARLACRPATTVQWVHDNIYVPMGIHPDKVGKCGFCITGNSGGSSQVSFALSFYGLDTIVDGLFPTSGPPHAAQTKGCIIQAGNEAYRYDESNSSVIDNAYGDFSGNGPCAQGNRSDFASRWSADSVEAGNDFYHPTTRVRIIFGGSDGSVAPAHGRDYYARLQTAGTPYLSTVTIPGVKHGVADSPAGAADIKTALLGDTGVLTGGGGSTTTPPISPTPVPSGSSPQPTKPGGSTTKIPKTENLGQVAGSVGNILKNPTDVGSVLSNSDGIMSLIIVLILAAMLGITGVGLYVLWHLDRFSPLRKHVNHRLRLIVEKLRHRSPGTFPPSAPPPNIYTADKK